MLIGKIGENQFTSMGQMQQQLRLNISLVHLFCGVLITFLILHLQAGAKPLMDSVSSVALAGGGGEILWLSNE